MTSYDNKIANNDYCSDRYEPAEPSPLKTAFLSEWPHVYGIYNRTTFTNAEDFSTYSFAPSLTCVTADKVNAKAVLITTDEYVLAGGAVEETNNYLKKSYSYWTMSPAGFSVDHAESYRVDRYGSLNGDAVDNDYGVRPVITLNVNATIRSGEGTSANPYIIN